MHFYFNKLWIISQLSPHLTAILAMIQNGKSRKKKEGQKRCQSDSSPVDSNLKSMNCAISPNNRLIARRESFCSSIENRLIAREAPFQGRQSLPVRREAKPRTGPAIRFSTGRTRPEMQTPNSDTA
jgi:hypothetical protein